MKRNILKLKKGFTLLEMLLVMGIIAALVVGAFIVFPKVQASQRAEAEAKNIATIQAGVKAIYTSVSSYSGLNNTVAVGAKIFPDNMLIGTGTSASVVNAFKGQVVLGVSNDSPSGVDNSAFSITYTGVPAAECAKIVTSAAGNFYTISVGTGESTITSGNVKKAGSETNVGVAASSCNSGGNENAITFISL